ncbi:GNAT family N-acetyltransferase [Halorientalis brevis]|uniref:GNAT family N-acetyltransferase n=1 Tax=Halorientalis brevis TaxID=1126241 RepID=A0ABD6C6P8_9EURY|nr:GNAT family N-acetyltransferase [Halorientalis brevis]
MAPTVRQAAADDYEAVAAFTEDTWADRDVGDYIADVFREWVASDGPSQRTLVAEVDGDVVGLCQGVLLSDHEAWAQGMRVDPDFRGEGVAVALTEAVFEWARDRGATVCRNLVFSWNDAGLGQSRAVGFEPATQFRFAHPEPDADAEAPAETSGELSVTDDAAAAWSCWQRSAVTAELRGLMLDPTETWAVSELSRQQLLDVADDERVFAVQGENGTRAAAVRVRDYESTDGETRYAEYGFATWTDVPAAQTVFAAIERDAAALGVDETRVVIPETARHVSDAAYARANVGEAPEFVLEKDLSES